MKKLLSFLVIFILSVTISFAQNNIVDRKLSYDQTSIVYTGLSTDIIFTDSTWTYTVHKLNDARQYPYIYLDIDSISGTAAAVSIKLQSKVFPSQAYTTLSTVTWAATGDTAFVFDVSSANKSEYWRVDITGSTSTFKAEIQELGFKFVE